MTEVIGASDQAALAAVEDLPVLNVADLDAAMLWAGRCPAAQHGIVEVRAVWSM